MREILLQYFNIAFLMGKPQDLPAGNEQLKTGVMLAATSYILALMLPLGLGRAFLQASVDLVTTGIIMFFALVLVGRQERFAQAFGGLCGASLFINLAALPLFNLRPLQLDETGTPLAALSEFVLLVWGLSLLAHIIRHTFEVKMIISVIASFLYFIVLSSLIAAVLPAPAQTASSGSIDLLVAELDSTDRRVF